MSFFLFKHIGHTCLNVFVNACPYIFHVHVRTISNTKGNLMYSNIYCVETKIIYKLLNDKKGLILKHINLANNWRPSIRFHSCSLHHNYSAVSITDNSISRSQPIRERLKKTPKKICRNRLAHNSQLWNHFQWHPPVSCLPLPAFSLWSFTPLSRFVYICHRELEHKYIVRGGTNESFCRSFFHWAILIISNDFLHTIFCLSTTKFLYFI